MYKYLIIDYDFITSMINTFSVLITCNDWAAFANDVSSRVSLFCVDWGLSKIELFCVLISRIDEF